MPRQAGGHVTAAPPSREEMVALFDEVRATGEQEGAMVRALGGVGVLLRTPAAPDSLRREIGDVDVIARRKVRGEMERALKRCGLTPELEFNALQGTRRQIWWTADGRTHVDLFLGQFEMCHTLELEDRLLEGHPALPAADLLLSKLQIVELNMKDAVDAAALLLSNEVGDGDGGATINRARLVEVLSRDWGFYTTASDNLEKLPMLIREVDPAAADRTKQTARQIVELIEESPKSRGFKMRARIGRRAKWYELPDESLVG